MKQKNKTSKPFVPLFNNDIAIFVKARKSACCGSNWTQYLSVSDGHVIKHGSIGWNDCVARFKDDESAKHALKAAGWWEDSKTGRFFPEPQESI